MAAYKKPKKKKKKQKLSLYENIHKKRKRIAAGTGI